MATPASTALWAPVEARLPVGEVPPPLPPVDEVPPVPEPVEPESVAEAEALTESDGDGVVVGVAGGSFPSPGFTVDGSTSSPTTQARVCVSLTFVPSARVALTVKVVR
ncbi:hypothetical protein OG250_42135 [Streptomyces sp. NBC_00487]|uniref:hypothetical protein n=1 Tax=unclassified Streptomyces TaxID=2593676 RepID=UPI002E18B77D|nr:MULTISPECIES: hypothetical protein [unclassified Streptomyces]